MCGFLLFFNRDTKINNDQIAIISENIRRRGRDYYQEVSNLYNKWDCFICASILWTQGTTFQTQPMISDDNDILLWNGDIFDATYTERSPAEISDTTFIMNWLLNNNKDIVKLLSSVKGPYAFTFWDNTRKLLWIGRDVIGRHSLLWYLSENQVIVTSVACKSSLEFSEVPAVGIFKIEYDNEMNSYDVLLFPWSHCREEDITSQIKLQTISFEEQISNLDLKEIDWSNDSVECKNAISLLRETFENNNRPMEFMNALLGDDQNVYCRRVKEFLTLLKKSVRTKVSTLPTSCRICNLQCSHVKVAILFSGGLDSTILALLADEYVNKDEPIDLMNVAFIKKTEGDLNNVPDRKTGISSYYELKDLCPHRKWNFIEINVTMEQLTEERKHRICHLIYPLNTVLDDSLGCALWFASRGVGVVNDFDYESNSRVLLSGFGADEQLGGYMRHRNFLNREGYSGLAKQLFLETLRMSRRNLGRDNRITSDHGRQCRFPYLSEDIVVYLNRLPPWERCGSPFLPVGVGDKLLLRLLAWHLGLRTSAVLPKRAMQFGCRIANRKEKGNVLSVNL